MIHHNIYSYGNYSSNNYGVHCLCVEIGNKKYYFSYDTLVSFDGYNSQGRFFNCTIKNYWGNTTGKHLNWLEPNKKLRLDKEEFEKLLEEFER